MKSFQQFNVDQGNVFNTCVKTFQNRLVCTVVDWLRYVIMYKNIYSVHVYVYAISFLMIIIILSTV